MKIYWTITTFTYEEEKEKMNILFINERKWPDYLADSVFHGLKNSCHNIHEFSDDTAWYMYDTEQSRERWKETFETQSELATSTKQQQIYTQNKTNS